MAANLLVRAKVAAAALAALATLAASDFIRLNDEKVLWPELSAACAQRRGGEARKVDEDADDEEKNGWAAADDAPD
jgi:hypothetical protein